jgi:hypothetical protein
MPPILTVEVGRSSAAAVYLSTPDILVCSFMIAGPRITRNMVGKMKNTNGNNNFTAALLACS